jgi:hypothetical protein
MLAGLLASATIAMTPIASAASTSDVVRQRMAGAGAKVESGVQHAGHVTAHALKRAIAATGRGVAHALDRTGEALSRAGSRLRGENVHASR